MLRGRSRAKKLSTNDLIDLNEQRSSLRISTRADSLSCRIRCLASFAASIFLAARMTWTFRRANTLAVSNPIPLAPPANRYDAVNIWSLYIWRYNNSIEELASSSVCAFKTQPPLKGNQGSINFTRHLCKYDKKRQKIKTDHVKFF